MRRTPATVSEHTTQHGGEGKGRHRSENSVTLGPVLADTVADVVADTVADVVADTVADVRDTPPPAPLRAVDMSSP